MRSGPTYDKFDGELGSSGFNILYIMGLYLYVVYVCADSKDYYRQKLCIRDLWR